MHNFSKGLRILGVIAAILVIGILVGWLETRKTGSNAQLAGAGPASSNALPTDRVPFFSTKSRPRPAEIVINKSTMQPSSTGTNIIADWEDKLEDILGSDA